MSSGLHGWKKLRSHGVRPELMGKKKGTHLIVRSVFKDN
jgi:hypothetical protein